MDADVFFSSKVLKLVGTSVTYDLGHDRMWESAGTRQQTFFLLRSTRVTTVTAPVNPLSNTTIFITSVIVNERLNHTQLKITITPMFMKLLFRLLVKPCHHLHPHLFNNIYTFVSCVTACTALKVWLRYLDRIIFLFVLLL